MPNTETKYSMILLTGVIQKVNLIEVESGIIGDQRLEKEWGKGEMSMGTSYSYTDYILVYYYTAG